MLGDPPAPRPPLAAAIPQVPPGHREEDHGRCNAAMMVSEMSTSELCMSVSDSNRLAGASRPPPPPRPSPVAAVLQVPPGHREEYHGSSNAAMLISEMTPSELCASEADSSRLHAGLVDNDAGRAVTPGNVTHPNVIETLIKAGITVTMNQSCSRGRTLPMRPNMGVCAEHSGNSGTDSEGGSFHTVSHTTGSCNSAKWQAALLMQFFQTGTLNLEGQHLELERLVAHVFNPCTDGPLFVKEPETSPVRKILALTPPSIKNSINGITGSRSSLSSTMSSLKGRLSTLAGENSAIQRDLRFIRKLIKQPAFNGTSLVVTLYCIFGPELNELLGDQGTVRPVLTANTVAFCLLLLELLLNICGQVNYLCIMSGVLDLISLVGLSVDTWLFAGESDSRGARRSGTAPSSRFQHLVSIARVVRLPLRISWFLDFVTRRASALDGTVLSKKIWHMFLLLDTDNDSFVTILDLKFFYFSILQECPHMLKGCRQDMLQSDLFIFNQEGLLTDTTAIKLPFREFNRIFFKTQLGQNMIAYYRSEIHKSQSIWYLVNRISQGNTVKVCLFALLVVVIMSVFKTDIQDTSPERGLMHLELMARQEHNSIGANCTYLCIQIGLYAAGRKVLLLFLDGRTHYEDGACLPAGVPAAERNPFARAQSLIQERSLRHMDVLQACLPAHKDQGCDPARTSSMLLLDRTAEAGQVHLFGLLMLLIVTLLLLLLMFLINTHIENFTKMFMVPLQSLADDMMAAVSLDALTKDDDADRPESMRPQMIVKELQELQSSFLSMRKAIRSWSKYVPPCVVQRLFNAGIEATIGVSKCYVTILFCDIYDFEDVCRGLPPAQLLVLLSQVLGTIAHVIAERRGTLLEFIGDEVLAVFSAPDFLRYHEYAAMASALEIHREVDRLPTMAMVEGKEIRVRCRIGINTAQILAGNIGSKNRMKYGVLGDGVNLAARLKSLNSRYRTQTLVSADMIGNKAWACKRHFIHRPVDIVAVKGKKAPTTVLELMAEADGADVSLIEAVSKHKEAFRLYQQQAFEEAAKLFMSVNGLLARAGIPDQVSSLMQRRCSAYIHEPPPDDWDGVEHLTCKTWQNTADDPPAALSPFSEERGGTSL